MAVPDVNAPLDSHALQEAHTTIEHLRSAYPLTIEGSQIKRIPLHWSAEAFGCVDRHYNGVVALVGGVWKHVIATDPRLNSTEPPQVGYAAHTYMANGNAFGIALNGMDGISSASDSGDWIQGHELDCLESFAAAVAIVYGIDTVAIDDDQKIYRVATHAEYAARDRYFPGDGDPDPRWDLACFAPQSGPVTRDQARASGNLLRQRVHAYKLELLGKTIRGLSL